MILSDEKRTVIKGKGIAIINEFGDIIEGLLSNGVLDKDEIIKFVEIVAEKVKSKKDSVEESEDKDTEHDVRAIEITGDKAVELLKVIKKALEDGKNG